ncbi:MAG: ABC transporter ATP-binding protein [Eubacteriales bacterium]|jgi:cobalt/nickel transport system ATP-binding protein
MLELRHVSFHYKNTDTAALDDISIRFEDGRCYCIEGPNGCGKSTLFRILLGLDFADLGSYLFNGREVTQKSMRSEEFSRELHRKTGFLFQDSEIQLFTDSVEHEIMFGPEQLGLPDEEVQRLTEKYLKTFGLEEIRDRAPFNISGGEKKRTALAAVCAMKPEVLILDEPLAGLDEEGQEWLIRFMHRLKEQHHLLIIATHNRALASEMADIHVRMDRHHRIISVTEADHRTPAPDVFSGTSAKETKF